MVWLQLITVLVLGAIAWEDLRERSIHWWWLPILATVLVVPAYLGLTRAELFVQMGFNLAFLGLQLTATLLLLLFRQRKWVNPVNTYIGIGDLLFFVVLALGLSRANFVLFYLSGLALCIPAYYLLINLKPKAERSVPTAGFMALYLMAWAALDLAGLVPGLYTGSVTEYLLANDR